MDITFEDGRKSSLTNDIAIHDIKLNGAAAARAAGGLMSEDLGFFIALMVSGLSIGLMYSLIALGFVLVYKATDAINFAQGEFVMLAALVAAVVAGLSGLPVVMAIAAVIATVAVMIGFSFALESASCCGRCSGGRSSRSSWRPSGSPPCCADCRRSRSAARRARCRCRSATMPIRIGPAPCRRSRCWGRGRDPAVLAASPGSS